MPDLKFTIRTDATGTGIKQTSEQLKGLAQETDKTTLSKGHLSKAVQKLTHEFPILGTVASALRHPIVGIAAAIALLVREIFKQIDAQNKLAESAGETVSQLTLLEGTLLKGSDNARQFADSARALTDAIDAVTKAAREPEKALTEQEKQIEKQLEREKEILRVRKDFVTSKIERDRDKGLISDEEAVKRKFGVENFFAKETARIEDQAAQKKIALQATAHMQAQKDFQGAKDANEDAVKRTKEAKDIRDTFNRGEKKAAEERAKRDAVLAEQENKATSEVATEQAARTAALANLDFITRGQLERGEISPAIALGTRLEDAQRRLDDIRAERKTIATTGQIQARKGRDLGFDVTASEKFEKDTIAAAADATRRAESTRKSVVEGTIESRTALSHADELGILRQKIAEVEAERAAYKELLEATKENAALRKREIEQIKSENSDIKQRLSSAANKTQ